MGKCELGVVDDEPKDVCDGTMDVAGEWEGGAMRAKEAGVVLFVP